MSRNKSKKPQLRLKKQTLAKLDEAELEVSQGGMTTGTGIAPTVPPTISGSFAIRCTMQHNRRALALA
jgi:hypothetical protein